ncbi:MAG: hypothetical protein ACMXYL_02445 [Candidatus Woesearchaeota archaeon]
MLENFEILGEESIRDFLVVEGIRHVREPEIHELIGDNKKWRRIDFYLPDYKVYFEYLGRWNDKKGRKEYSQKMALFKSNSIPCIYLYPNELSTLKQSFYKKLHRSLIRRGMGWKAFKSILKVRKMNYFAIIGGLALITFLSFRSQSTIELTALLVILFAWSLYLASHLCMACRTYHNLTKEIKGI